MARIMKRIAFVSALGAAFFAVFHHYVHAGAALSLAITCATISFHMLMRFTVGWLFDRVMHNRANLKNAWFRTYPWEMPLYRRLRVKSWKGNLPTYDGTLFDPRLHTWLEIAQATRQSELVHEVNMILSFAPLLMPRWFGAFGVFLITSVLAACCDLPFVLMQRFNRARLLAMQETALRAKGRATAKSDT